MEMTESLCKGCIVTKYLFYIVLLLGSIAEADKRFIDFDVIACIEL